MTLNYVYLPIRAAQHPPINEGEPIGFFSQALSDVINRLQYGKPPVSQRMSPLGAQLGHVLALLELAVGQGHRRARQPRDRPLHGALRLGARHPDRARPARRRDGSRDMLFILTLLLIYYLNFRYMYTYPNVSPDEHEVRERDYFFVASFAFVGVLLAAGFAAAIRATAEWLGDRITEQRRWLAGTPVLALALIPLFGNRLSAPRNHETLASDFAVDMLQSVEPYGILITAGDNDTFPLWFAQEVLGVRQRRDARQPVADEHRLAPAPAQAPRHADRSIPRDAPHALAANGRHQCRAAHRRAARRLGQSRPDRCFTESDRDPRLARRSNGRRPRTPSSSARSGSSSARRR